MAEAANIEMEYMSWKLFCETANKNKASFTLDKYRKWIHKKGDEATAWVKRAATLVPKQFCEEEVLALNLKPETRNPKR